MSIRKVDVNVEMAYCLLHPIHTVLVTSVNKGGKANIITLAWVMPTSANPPACATSVATRRYSHKLIEEIGEFVINVPTMDIINQTLMWPNFGGRI